MSEDEQRPGDLSAGLADRVRALAQAFLETDLVRLRIEDENEDAVEFRRRPSPAPVEDDAHSQAPAATAPANLHPIKADLVGIFRFSRPAVFEGELLDGDRELAFVDALGIRNPVRSLGGGRVASVLCQDGQPVEYGQVLFEIDRT
jgi:biotin carboxyl carrier protein